MWPEERCQLGHWANATTPPDSPPPFPSVPPPRIPGAISFCNHLLLAISCVPRCSAGELDWLGSVNIIPTNKSIELARIVRLSWWFEPVEFTWDAWMNRVQFRFLITVIGDPILVMILPPAQSIIVHGSRSRTAVWIRSIQFGNASQSNH